MASVAGTVRRINDELDRFLPEDLILDACREAGHTWRRRKLGPVRTLQLFIVQVLCFNTAMTHLRLLGDSTVKAGSYCKARMRLPLAALQSLLRRSVESMRLELQQQLGEQGRWCGLRPLLVDGSSTIAPDTPSSQKAFGQPKGCKAGCGFPVPKVLGLFDAVTGLLMELLGFPLYTHEQSKVCMLHPMLGVGDLLVGDRGFCSFAHLSMLFGRGVQGLFRMHQRQIVDFRPHRKCAARGKKRGKGKGKTRGLPTSKFIQRLGKHDQIVEWAKPRQKPKWMEAEQYAALPATLLVRELRYVIPRKGQRTVCVTIATTLLDPLLYPREKIAELYNVRWAAETHFAELKTTLKMRKLKSKTADGVRKELAVYALVYNLVHMVMVRAALRQATTPDRISFIDAVRVLLSAEGEAMLVDLVVNPSRPGRHEPRVVKDREDTYTKMTRPRNELRRELRKA